MDKTKDKDKEKGFLKINPKTNELHEKLEKAEKKLKKFDSLENENERLKGQIKKLKERTEETLLPADNIISKTKKKIALQEILNEKRLNDESLKSHKKRLKIMLNSMEDQEKIQDVDSQSIRELKSTLDTFIENRKLRTSLISKLNGQNQELFEENQDLKFSVGKLTHDLRSLMSSITGVITLVEMGQEDAAEKYLPELKNRCDVFMDLINILNDEPIKKIIIDFDEILQLIELKGENDESIVMEIDGNLSNILADKAALYNILQNMVNNSKKYAGKTENELVITIELSEDDENSYIIIGDNGVGIPEEHISDIFKLYNRAGKKDAKGKGLGLFMVKKLIDQHSGIIEYVSSFDRGAQFKMTFPKNTSSDS